MDGGHLGERPDAAHLADRCPVGRGDPEALEVVEAGADEQPGAEVAEVGLAARAPATLAAGGQEREDDVVAHLEALGVGADGGDHAGALVAAAHRVVRDGDVAGGDVVVGVAHPGGGQLDLDLAGARVVGDQVDDLPLAGGGTHDRAAGVDGHRDLLVALVVEGRSSHAWARMTGSNAMARVTPWKEACNLGGPRSACRATCGAPRRHWRGARGPRRRRGRRAGRPDGGAPARPPGARRCSCSRSTPSPIPCPGPCTWTTRCSACCRRPAWPTRCAARSRPFAGLRLLDGRHRVLAEFRRDPAAGPNGWPQGSFVHQPDLEAVLAAAAGAAPGRHRPARRRGHRTDPGRRRRDRGRPRRRGGPVRPRRRGPRLRRRGQHRAAADRLVDARPRAGRPLARARRPVAGPAAGLAGRAPGLRLAPAGDVHAGHRRPVPLGVPDGAGGDRRGRHDPGPAGRAARAGRPGRRRDRPGGRVHVPGAGRRPLAGRPGVPGRRRRPPQPAVRRAGDGPRAARRAPARLEAGRRPRRRGRCRPARHLPGGAGAARPGADPGRPAARPADDARRPRRRRRAPRRPGRRPADPGGRPAGDRQPDAAAACAGRRSSAAAGPGGGWPARWCRSPRWSSTGDAAGSTTCWTTCSTGPSPPTWLSCAPGTDAARGRLRADACGSRTRAACSPLAGRRRGVPGVDPAGPDRAGGPVRVDAGGPGRSLGGGLAWP